ncbi:MAG TPA: helix-turn-helix transcriptional regulator [Candidatus Deferrimicrobium sp.]|nr:helix-turn-helix transcriptional regulator [Candidatus Deferrimicrobium sp.]
MPLKKRQPLNGLPQESARMIGQRLSEFRNNLGIGLAQLAQDMAVAPALILKIEKGIHPLPSDWLTRLRRQFGLNTDWLLTGLGPPLEEKLPAYLELLLLIQVPVVAAEIIAALNQAKVQFQDKIQEAATLGKIII